MLNKQTEHRLKELLADDNIFDQVILRLVEKTPSIDHISRIDNSIEMQDKIRSRFRSVLANYDHGSCGEEIAERLNGCGEVLKKFSKKEPLEQAKKFMGSDLLDKVTLEAMILGLKSIESAKDFEKNYDLMVNTAQRLSYEENLGSETLQKQEPESPIKISFVRKRIRLKKYHQS